MRFPGCKSLCRLAVLALLICFISCGCTSPGPNSSEPGGPKIISLVVQTGHTEEISAIAFSPDQKLLATASLDHTVKLWDLTSGAQLHTFSLANSPRSAQALSFTPDSTKLACGDSNGYVTIWSLAGQYELKHQLLHSENPEQAAVRSLAFSPDGQTLASGGDDCLIHLWNLAQLKALEKPDAGKKLASHKGAVTSLVVSPTGKFLVSGSADKSIVFWDLASGSPTKKLEGANGEISTLALNRDQTQLASGSYDEWELIRIWDVSKGIELFSLPGQGEIVSFADNNTLEGVGRKKKLEIWDLNTKQLRNSYKVAAKPKAVGASAIASDGKLLAVANGLKIDIFDASTGAPVKELKGHTSQLSHIGFSRDGKSMAFSGADRCIRVLDLTSGRELLTFQSNDEVLCLALSHDGSKLASGGYGLKVWDVATGKLLFDTPYERTGHVETVAFDPKGTILASGGDVWRAEHGRDSSLAKTRGKPGDFITLWDATSGRILRTLKDHTDEVFSLQFSPDGKTLASGSADSTAMIWDVASGRCLKTLRVDRGFVRSVAYNADGSRLGTASDLTKIWNVSSGAQICEISDNSGPLLVRSLILAPDNKTVITDKMSLNVWTIDSGATQSKPALINRPSNTLLTDSKPIQEVVLSPDGTVLAGCSEEGELTLWRTSNWSKLCNVIPLDKNDWAVCAENGSFDSTRNALDLMRLRVGNDIVDLAQIKHRYFQPGLLAKLIGFDKEALHKVIPLANTNACPEVIVEPPAPGSSIAHIKLKNRGGGFGQLQVKLNERLIDNKLVARGGNQNASEDSIDIDLTRLPQIPGQENTIVVKAFDKDNLLASRDVRVKWTPSGKKQESPIEFYAIVCGVSKYASKDLNLRFSSKDASDIAKAVSLGGNRLFGPEHVHIRLLANAEGQDSKIASPTKKNIQDALLSVRQKAKSNDIVFLYLAGHGTTLTGQDDTYCYLTADAYTNELDDKSVRDQTAITSNELSDWSRSVPALKQVLVLDTCGAGGAAQKLTERRNLSSDQIRAIDKLNDTTGVYILMGCASDAVSYEASRFGQGLLTYSILKGMKGEKLAEEKYVEVAPLFEFAAEQVRLLARNLGGVQKPEIAIPKGSSFPIGLLTAADLEAIPLAKGLPVIVQPQFMDSDSLSDSLDLKIKLKQRLLEASQKQQTAFAYVDNDGYPHGLKPSGLYTVNGDSISANMVLSCDGQKVKLPVVQGSSKQMDGFTSAIVSAIEKALPQFKANRDM